MNDYVSEMVSWAQETVDKIQRAWEGPEAYTPVYTTRFGTGTGNDPCAAYECTGCGAVTQHREVHTAWHDRIESRA